MITVEHLTKRFGSAIAVDGLSMYCPPGTVTGFLGPNGAGKSTTLQMVTGLVTPTAGTARVLGTEYRKLRSPGRQVGVLLDASAIHPGRTGRETLALTAKVVQVPHRTVDRLLHRVGLDPSVANKRVRKYSLGMRQRLGIAHALLGDPQVLILDEPANGLDPDGIRWIRELLRDFADRGGTVLLSSHLLHEIQALADQLVIINHGQIVASGSTDQLLAKPGSIARTDSHNQTHLLRAIAQAGITATQTADGALAVDASPRQIAAIAASIDTVLIELRADDTASLEDLYLTLTSEADRGNVSDAANAQHTSPAERTR